MQLKIISTLAEKALKEHPLCLTLLIFFTTIHTVVAVTDHILSL
jgi:hypothetical protein